MTAGGLKRRQGVLDAASQTYFTGSESNVRHSGGVRGGPLSGDFWSPKTLRRRRDVGPGWGRRKILATSHPGWDVRWDVGWDVILAQTAKISQVRPTCPGPKPARWYHTRSHAQTHRHTQHFFTECSRSRALYLQIYKCEVAL